MILNEKSSIVILTGAGISAESGIATFRDSGGLWENHAIEDVATPQGFIRNPTLVYEFYNQRRKDAAIAQPNPAHEALSRLERIWRGNFLLVTQNVDSLHEKAGSKKLIHMHGELNSALCMNCHSHNSWENDINALSTCPQCGHAALRPDIVWFGEMPYRMNEIERSLYTADIFIAIGTSGQVHPAAGFVSLAKAAGAHTVEINLECDNPASSQFDEHLCGLAGQMVPQFVRRIVAQCLNI